MALLLEGVAGIGKTTLWLAGVEEAQRRGRPVLQARPAEAEARLAFAGLGDLLDGVLEDVVGASFRARRPRRCGSRCCWSRRPGRRPTSGRSASHC